MRYIVTDDREVTLGLLESELQQIDNYRIERDADDETLGDLMHENALYGRIELCRPGDGLFEEEIEDLKGFIAEVEGDRKNDVLNVLNSAKTMVVVQVLDQGRRTEETLVMIDPLWTWLIENRQGLMQADGEGYYENQQLILEV
jgi:hypothetical protein